MNRYHRATGPRKYYDKDKPKAAPFNAKAIRDHLNNTLIKSEIAYLVKSFIDKGNKFDKLNEDSRFKSIWTTVEPEVGVTLSRICQSFPEVTCKYLQSCPGRPISLQDCIKASGCAEFPTIARHSSCATLIPENFNFRVEALEVVLMASMIFAEKVQPQEIAELPPKERLEHHFEFLKKSFYSPVLPEGDRWELSSEFGIVAEDGGLTGPWSEAAEAACSWLKKTYSCNIHISNHSSLFYKDTLILI